MSRQVVVLKTVTPAQLLRVMRSRRGRKVLLSSLIPTPLDSFQQAHDGVLQAIERINFPRALRHDALEAAAALERVVTMLVNHVPPKGGHSRLQFTGHAQTRKTLALREFVKRHRATVIVGQPK